MQAHYTLIVVCLLGGVQALNVGEDLIREEPKGFLSKIFHALFPPLDPLPEDLLTDKLRPIKPIVNPIKGEAASLLGLLGSVVGQDVKYEYPITQKPTVVRVSVTVPPADRYYKPEIYRKRRQTNLAPALPINLGAIYNQGPNQLSNVVYSQEKPSTSQYPMNNLQYVPNNNVPYPTNNNLQYLPINNNLQYQTLASYESQQYNQPISNQTYNQSYGTTKKPYYYYTTLKPRPASPVIINVTLPVTTSTTTTHKPYTIIYNKPYKPYYKPYYKPSNEAPYTPYDRE